MFYKHWKIWTGESSESLKTSSKNPENFTHRPLLKICELLSLTMQNKARVSHTEEEQPNNTNENNTNENQHDQMEKGKGELRLWTHSLEISISTAASAQIEMNLLALTWSSKMLRSSGDSSSGSSNRRRGQWTSKSKNWWFDMILEKRN